MLNGIISYVCKDNSCPVVVPFQGTATELVEFTFTLTMEMNIVSMEFKEVTPSK